MCRWQRLSGKPQSRQVNGPIRLVLMAIYHLIALTGCHSPTLRPTAAEPSELLIQNYSFRSSELNRQVVLTLEFSFTDEGSSGGLWHNLFYNSANVRSANAASADRWLQSVITEQPSTKWPEHPVHRPLYGSLKGAGTERIENQRWLSRKMKTPRVINGRRESELQTLKVPGEGA